MARIDKLRDLESKLCIAMEECSHKELASIAKQYRETIKEIEEIEGSNDNEDDIAAILSGRASDGKSGPVRSYRS